MWPFTRQTNNNGATPAPKTTPAPLNVVRTMPTAPSVPTANRTKVPASSAPMTPAAPDNKTPAVATPELPAVRNFVSGPPRRLSAAEAQEQAEEARRLLRANTDRLYLDRAEAEAREVERRKASKASAEAEAARLASLPPTFEQQFKPWRTPLNGLNRQFIDFIVQRGELSAFVDEARQKCAPHIRAFAEGWAELSKFSRDEVRKRVRAAIETNIAAAKNGDVSAVVDVIDEDKISREYDFRRKALRERLRAASTACKPSVTALAEKFQSTCRSIAGQMMAEEKSAAEAIGVQFDQPSAALKQIIACGFEGEDFLNAAFHPSPSSDPADALCGLLKSE